MDIHENILKMITILVSELNNKENELTIHKSKQHIGLNIDNFVTTFNFNNNVMKERITMFITYIEFFHKLHTKYLKRFSNKIQLIYTDINNDIKFDESLEINSSNSSTNGTSISNNIKKINQYSIGDSDNESNKSNKTLSRKNSSTNLSDTSISSKSENSSTKNLMNSNYIYENMTNIKIVSNNYNEDNFDEINGIEIDKSVSDEEMNELFLNIESSCDSIINKKKEIEEVEVINVTVNQEIIDSIESSNNIEVKIEEKEEPNITKTIELNNTTDNEPEPESQAESQAEPEPESQAEPDTKKKRTYKPRKKKI
jgi:hypothetical protein